MQTREIERSALNGWAVVVALVLSGVALGCGEVLVLRATIPTMSGSQPDIAGSIVATAIALLMLLWLFCCFGFFTLQPNVAGVLVLFGKYKGTVGKSGFHWANPLMLKKKVSVRARNLNGHQIKVNDRRGNPIEIAVVAVWRVSDTARAIFDVDEFEDYMRVQSEAALRHLAMAYSYDTFEDDTITLRGSIDEVSQTLQKEVQERVARAGIAVEEARISHLAYAPEIAGAMLQRQQAEAIVSARSKIVEGAVGMVEMALAKLEEHQTVVLDEERKVAMISNLLVVLCGQEHAQPIVNTGTLYT